MTTSNYFFGRTKEEQIGTQPQYFYGLRRNDDGELFLTRVNQLSRADFFVFINLSSSISVSMPSSFFIDSL